MQSDKWGMVHKLRTWLILGILHASFGFHDEYVNLECRPCNSSEFCHAGLRYRCPTNSESDPNFLPNDIHDCVCLPGYNRTGDICPLGTAPFWYYAGVQQTCVEYPRRVTIVDGAWRAQQCVCIPGYSEIEAFGNSVPGLCAKCPVDAYNSHYNSSCVNCPEHSSHSELAQTLITSCTCDPGYTGSDGGPCAACINGKFKTYNGSALCETCAENTFSDGIAAIQCTACPANSTSPVGTAYIGECLCDPGFERIGDECRQCSAGKFKGVSGNELCVLCETDTQYIDTVGATACLECNAHSTSIATRELCLCDVGYSQENTPESGLVQPTCTACAPNTYQNLTGQTTCVACDPNAQSPSASDALVDCVCNKGYIEVSVDLGICQACATGSYKDVEDDTVLTCTNCPDDSNSPSASPALTSCACNAGFDGTLGGPCVACDPGYFKESPSVFGNETCLFCPVNTFSPDFNSTSCTDCFDNSIAPEGSNDLAYCICDAANGYAEIDADGERACSSCAPGTYATSDGFDTGAGCANCSLGTFTNTYGETICDICPVNTSSHSSPRTECECDPGYRCPDLLDTCDANCEECEADTFKEAYGYSPSCTSCQADAQSPPASTDKSACLCNAGFFHEQDYSSAAPYTCAPCFAGTYTDTTGESQCNVCAVNYFTPMDKYPWDTASDCVACGLCAEHEYDAARDGLGCGLAIPTLCQTCPLNSGTSHNDTFEARNINITSCACNAGYYGPLGGPCQLCPAGFVKTERFDRDTTIDDCIQCPANTYEVNQAMPCYDCLAHSSSQPGSTEKQHCICEAGRENIDTDIVGFLSSYPDDSSGLADLATAQLPPDFSGAIEDNGLTVCRQCARGQFKELAGAQSCQACAPDTYQNVTGKSYCDACPLNMSSGTEATECYCDPSFENVDGEHHDCTLCREASYKTDFGNQICTTCDSCRDNQQVDVECAPGNNITCKACQEASWNPAGSTLRGPCLCDAGYELTYDSIYVDGYTCLACQVGEYRTTNNNNSVMCKTCGAFTFTTETATVSCLPCTNTCDDSSDTSTNAYYVSVECTPSTDIVCTKCTVCPARYYANRTCGEGFNNDRSDTTCAFCPSNTYCTGNGTVPVNCPSFSSSVTGSSTPTDCVCNPGYYKVETESNGVRITDIQGNPSHKCMPCPFDTYCTGDQQISTCPAHSFTHDTTNSLRLDCQCHRGYYRTASLDTSLTFDTGFECSICTPNDYCFDNLRYNCSDDRMLSDVGSASFANCTCMDGFYNNGTKCETCPIDSYCVDGLVQACPVHEWTNYQIQQSTCVCRPGYHSPGLLSSTPKACVICPTDHFCTGVDDTKTNCTPHSTSAQGSSLDIHCQCLPAYQNVTLQAPYTTPSPTAHACELCADEFHKETTGNTQCEPCTVCLPDPDGVYELQACRRDYDARCAACDPCTNGSIWTSQDCSLLLDAVCSPCTTCTYSTQYLDIVCTSQNDAVCRPISFNRSCPIGQYAGGHTDRADSQCIACQYRDTPYFGQHLHTAASMGQIYNDQYSCKIACLGQSKMVDANNHSLGCVSCETGNVLLRQFSLIYDQEGQSTACSFTCRDGFIYDEVADDCFAPALKQSNNNFFSHSINVSNWRRSLSGFVFTVTHTNHSRYVVAVGQSVPTDCKYNDCCFSHMWRVSTLSQLGISESGNENCSRTPALLHSRLHYNSLEFEIPDTMQAEVGDCQFTPDAIYECSYVVTLVDVVLHKATSQTVVTRTQRAMTYAFLNGAHRYIPLETFKVDLFLAYTDAHGAVYLVVTETSSAYGTQNITVRVPGMTPLNTPPIDACTRVGLPTHTVYPAIPSVSVNASTTTFATYWRAPTPLDQMQVFYSLRHEMEPGQVIPDIMDIAAVRNTTYLTPLCTPKHQPKIYAVGFVMAVAGMGEDSITQMYRLHDMSRAFSLPQETRGELGSLITFLAQSYSPFVTSITMKSVLASHLAGKTVVADVSGNITSPAALAILNATELHNGMLDFTYEYRQWCRSLGTYYPGSACLYEYLHYDTRDHSMFAMPDCTTPTKDAARAWLKATFGVVHDAGHIEALCAKRAQSTTMTHAILVNSMAYLPKHNTLWNHYQNFTGTATRTYVWPNFYFLS